MQRGDKNQSDKTMSSPQTTSAPDSTTPEIITIVDEQNNVLGGKDRAKITPDDIYRVAVLFIVDKLPPHTTKVLLAQRALTKKQNPGMWGPSVAGTVPYNEDYTQTIIRETAEELGLNLTPNDLTWAGTVKIRVNALVNSPNSPKSTQTYQYFAGIYLAQMPNIDPTTIKFDPNEVAGVKWFGTKQLASLLQNNVQSKRFLPSLFKLLKAAKII